MSETQPVARGRIELDRTIDSIVVGKRYRKDPGDLTSLMDSIDRLGLLQPATITPDGVLVCGWRRLEAVRRLGWRSMNVWVRSGISGQLESLLAQQDDNELHKPLNEIEKATLYLELKQVRAEEAERRKQATQFGNDGIGGGSGPGTVPGPGDARRQAAMAITGRESYHTHEWVCALMDWASRKATPPEIRAMANDALRRIENGEPVKPLYRETKAAHDEIEERQAETDLARLAREALERITAEQGRSGAKRTQLNRNQSPTSHYRSVRSFNLTWNELDGWTEMYDVDALAAQLTPADWERFDRVVTATIAFRDQLIAARRDACANNGTEGTLA